VVDKDWGGKDVLDHVEGLKRLEKDPRIDSKRRGVVGRSYGGYMTLTLASRHPELWKAAVDMFGPYDLQHGYRASRQPGRPTSDCRSGSSEGQGLPYRTLAKDLHEPTIRSSHDPSKESTIRGPEPESAQLVKRSPRRGRESRLCGLRGRRSRRVAFSRTESTATMQ